MTEGRLTLRGRTMALCLAVGLLLLGMAVSASALAARSRAHTDDLASQIKAARTAVEQLNASATERRSAMRGYAATNLTRELDEYTANTAEGERQLTELRRLYADDPRALAQLDRLAGALQRWHREVADPVVRARRAGGPTAGAAALARYSGGQYAAVRAESDQLTAMVVAETDRAVEEVRRIGDRLNLLLTSAAIFVMLAAALLLVALQRWVIRPVTTLAGHVRAVAAGDFRHRIVGTGPPELNRLASDIDTMRQRIADDLEAVRAAQHTVVEAKAALEAQAEELTRSNRDLEQFAYVASHDLQEPLRKVASFCQLLQRRYGGQLDEKADQYIDFAVDGAQRMQRLINDLLAFSRIGRRPPEPVAVDLGAVMQTVSGQLDSGRRSVGGEIRWQELPVVAGEESLICTVLTNLVANALKFRRPDEPPVVEVAARRDGAFWEVTVRDNGIGIAPEYADKVFVIFQRLHGRDAYPGTGIGLAIVKKIVEYHGGRVWLEPPAADGPTGTTMRFTLPALSDATEPAQSTVPESGRSDTPEESAA